VTGHEDGERTEDGPIVVELAFEDTVLAGRVRSRLVADPDLSIAGLDGVPASVLVTDGVGDFDTAAPVLVLAAGPDAVQALRAGAAAVLPRHASAAELVAAIRGVALGFTVIGQDLRDELIGRGDAGPDPDADTGIAPAEDDAATVELTDRELQVLTLLADGASNKAIARALAITPHTAKFHVASIAAKLGVTGRTEAVAKAMRLGLLMV
jgi:DNA-binding NarL/FixJ family response regulator